MSKLVWKKTEKHRWISEDGKYEIWVQSRIRWGNSYELNYAVSHMDERPRLTESSPSLSDAKLMAQSHADKGAIK